MTHAQWVLLPKYIVLWLNHAEIRPLARQIHNWSDTRQLRSFLDALLEKWSPDSVPEESNLREKRKPPIFDGGVLREDAGESRSKGQARKKRNAKRPANDQELPEEVSNARKKGAPVRITVTKAWVLPQFMTVDSLGQTVSNEIVDFDPRRDTIEHLVDILARHDAISHRQAVSHNALLIIFAARWDIYMLGCNKAFRDSYIQQARGQTGKADPVLYDQIEGMLWEYDGGRREVLNDLAKKYSARLATIESRPELALGDEAFPMLK